MTDYSAQSAIPSPARARHLTRHFDSLQGLAQLPIGALFLGMLLLSAWLPPTPRAFPRGAALATLEAELAAILVSGFVVAVLLSWSIRARYRRSFGTVAPRPGHRTWVVLVTVPLAFAVAYPLKADLEAWLATGRTLPLNLSDLALAGLLVLYWWYTSRTLHHYLVLAGLAFLLGLASLVGLTPATLAWHLRELLLLIATACIVGGILDHRALTRTMPKPPEGA